MVRVKIRHELSQCQKKTNRPHLAELSTALYLACPCAIIAPVIVGSGRDFSFARLLGCIVEGRV